MSLVPALHARPPAPPQPPLMIRLPAGREGGPGLVVGGALSPSDSRPYRLPCHTPLSPGCSPVSGRAQGGGGGLGPPGHRSLEKPHGLPSSSTARRLEPSRGYKGKQASAKAMAHRGAQVPPALPPHASLTQAISPLPCHCVRQSPAHPTPARRPTSPWALARLGLNLVGRCAECVTIPLA